MSFSREEWGAIVEAHYASLYDYAVRFLGSEAEAEDAIQDAFLFAFRSLRLPPLLELRPWLFTIVRNRCLDKRRWWRRWSGFLMRQGEAQAQVEPNDTRLDFRVLQVLPERQREIFILRHWHDFSTKQTAALLGISEGAVKSQLKKAIARLKEVFLRDKEH